jgi:hypothetical protein
MICQQIDPRVSSLNDRDRSITYQCFSGLVWVYDRTTMKTVSYEIAWFQIVIPALAGLLGVLVGGWITTRNQKIERQHQRIREQLSSFYSVLIGMHKQIREKSQVRVKLRGIANRAYENELKQAGDDQIAAKRIADASEPAYKKIMEIRQPIIDGRISPFVREHVGPRDQEHVACGTIHLGALPRSG